MQSKLIIALFTFAPLLAQADCVMRSASQNISEQLVSQPSDLTKTVKEGSCRVQFRINVNGTWHSVDREEKGEGSDNLCTQAIQNARTQLLAQASGVYQTDSVMRCTDGEAKPFRSVRVGDNILESELVRVNNKYFTWNKSKCRLFRERYEHKSKLQVAHGVICQTDNEDWIVVDKW